VRAALIGVTGRMGEARCAPHPQSRASASPPR